MNARFGLTLAAAAAFCSAASMASAAPAPASSNPVVHEIVTGDVPMTFARFGRHRGHVGARRGFRGGRIGRGARFGRRGFVGRPYGYRRGGGGGAAIAAGIAGLATGALVGGALAAQASPAPVVGSNAVAYCEQRFRSYDPSSGTYLGYDGDRHACP